ncbi:hypothetical protein [Mesorhizobium sp. f-mel]
MRQTARRPASGKHGSRNKDDNRPSLYHEVTSRTIAELEQGRFPWVQPRGLVAEALLAIDQQTHHLPLRDRDADRSQQRHQPRHGDLALMVLRQHEAAQVRPEGRPP